MTRRSARGRWKTLAEKYGQHASPWVAVGDSTDLYIGPGGHISLQELEQALARVRDELLAVYNPEDYEGLDQEQVLALLRDKLLELYAREPELLVEPEQALARVEQEIARLERKRDELLERLHPRGQQTAPGP